MSRRAAATLALAVALAAAAPEVRAQSLDTITLLRGRLARIDSALAAGERRVIAQAREDDRVNRRRSQVEGRFTFVVPAQLQRRFVTRAAALMDSIFTDFGAVPDSVVTRAVFYVGSSPSETWMKLDFAGRPRLRLDWRGSDSSPGEWALVAPVSRAFIYSLDSTWSSWMPVHFGVTWNRERDSEAALETLASSGSSDKGKECLAGTLKSCRLWLGIDADSTYTSRFSPAELLDAVGGRNVGGDDGRACRDGDVGACESVVLRLQYLLPRVPAPEMARAALIRSYRERYGAVPLTQAFLDRQGSIGDRLSRAAGAPVDTIISQWRMWILSSGRTERVQAGAGDAVAALTCIGLLLAFAARSGRWR